MPAMDFCNTMEFPIATFGIFILQQPASALAIELEAILLMK